MRWRLRRASVLLVSGEAGIGKTRLVAEVEAAAPSLARLHGECVEFGGEELAYAPVVAALRDLPAAWLAGWLDELSAEARGALAAVLPREAAGGGGPGQAVRAVARPLRLAVERPVLLVLEDIHWADRSTLALLAFLARNLRSERIVVLATYRVDDELSPELRRLAASCGRRRTVLAIDARPLGRDDVARQLEAIAGGPGRRRAGRRAVRPRGRQPVLRRGAVRRPRRAPRVTEAVLARVARLDRRPLAVLAAAGGQAATRCSSGSRSRPTRCARRSTPGCSSASATASRSGTG